MDRETQIRRLRYLARRRSTLELDNMLGGIVDRMPWDRLSDDDLAGVARIVETDDMVLQKALMGLTGPPPEARPDLWALFLERLSRPRIPSG